jgi:hypothetical protein
MHAVSPTPPGTTSEDVPYFRARAGGRVDGRRVGRILLGATLVILAVVVIATTIGAAIQDSNQTRLQRDGVPVEVTVTGCEGVSSGIGQALIYDVCRGSFTLDGRRYNAVIGGNRVAHPLGQTLRGVTVPDDPTLLSTAGAVAKKFSPWTPFITPIVLAVVTVALALGLVLRRRRVRSRPPDAPQAADTRAAILPPVER